MFDKLEQSNKHLQIIAKLSANHKQDFATAIETIKAAEEAGADGIKLQTYTADTLTSGYSNDYFTLNSGTIWDGKTYYELYQGSVYPLGMAQRIKRLC